MKIERLIGIITILLRQEKITAPQLAERFEVSRRTINRDIEDICMAGIPIVTTQGYGGGISIADDYKIDKSLFTDEELRTVLAALKGIDSVSKTSYLANLSDKLLSRNSRIVADDMFMIDLASHYQMSLVGKIDMIKKGVLGLWQMSFKYYYEKGEQQRVIEPYRLVFKWSSWYVFGYCLHRSAYRLFKLNRIWGLELLEEHFVGRDIPKEALDFGDYIQTKNIYLKALFAKSEKHRLIEEYGVNCYSTDENGELIFECDFASYDNMRQWILSFGDKVNIIEPQDLKEDRKRQAINMLNMPSIP